MVLICVLLCINKLTAYCAANDHVIRNDCNLA